MYFFVFPPQPVNSLGKVKTYVGEDGKLHFVDSEGADSVLPFSKGTENVYINANHGKASVAYTSNAYINTENFNTLIVYNKPYNSRFDGYLDDGTRETPVAMDNTITSETHFDISKYNKINQVSFVNGIDINVIYELCVD